MTIPLDFAAAACTGTSTLLLAKRKRVGFILLAVGVTIWFVVAVESVYAGRPLWGMMISQVWSFSWAVYGFVAWRGVH